MDISRVVVGVDPAHRVSPAMTFALRVAHVTGAEIVAVTITDLADTPLPVEAIDAALATVEREMAGSGHRVVVDVKHRIESFTGDPREVLAERAEAEGAELLVIGSRGGGGFLGLGVGGVAHHLVHHTPCPLAVVPADPDPIRNGVVVVGVDGSPSSARALDWAVGLAERAAGRVQAVFAHHPLADSFPHPATVENWTYPGEREAGHQVAALGAGAVPVSFLPAVGPPVAALAGTAAASSASMIVVGTRGRGGFGGLVVGRVPVQLLHHAHCPVVVVPHR